MNFFITRRYSRWSFPRESLEFPSVITNSVIFLVLGFIISCKSHASFFVSSMSADADFIPEDLLEYERTEDQHQFSVNVDTSKISKNLPSGEVFSGVSWVFEAGDYKKDITGMPLAEGEIHSGGALKASCNTQICPGTELTPAFDYLKDCHPLRDTVVHEVQVRVESKKLMLTVLPQALDGAALALLSDLLMTHHDGYSRVKIDNHDDLISSLKGDYKLNEPPFNDHTCFQHIYAEQNQKYSVRVGVPISSGSPEYAGNWQLTANHKIYPYKALEGSAHGYPRLVIKVPPTADLALGIVQSLDEEPPSPSSASSILDGGVPQNQSRHAQMVAYRNCNPLSRRSDSRTVLSDHMSDQGTGSSVLTYSQGPREFETILSGGGLKFFLDSFDPQLAKMLPDKPDPLAFKQVMAVVACQLASVTSTSS